MVANHSGKSSTSRTRASACVGHVSEHSIEHKGMKMRLCVKTSPLPKKATAILGIIALCVTSHLQAADFLLFPSFGGVAQSNPEPGTNRYVLYPELDLFYTANSDDIKFLGEYAATRDGREMERLLLGWAPNNENTLWFGRYHIPLGYWATEFHHGAFLQTSITPPAIAFDDEGGPFPTHPSGLFLEGVHYSKQASINYGLGLGIGPVLEEQQLTPLNILDPAGQKGKLVASARLSYRPEAETPNEIGVFAAHSIIPVIYLPVTEVTQNLTGLYFNQGTAHSRLFGELYLAGNQLDGAASARTSSFASAYIQEEYKIYSAWTLFGRIENTFGANGDPYLNLLPQFINRRVLGGARYEINANQAAKFELSQNRQQDGIHFSQLAIQWSMVIQ